MRTTFAYQLIASRGDKMCKGADAPWSLRARLPPGFNAVICKNVLSQALHCRHGKLRHPRRLCFALAALHRAHASNFLICNLRVACCLIWGNCWPCLPRMGSRMGCHFAIRITSAFMRLHSHGLTSEHADESTAVYMEVSPQSLLLCKTSAQAMHGNTDIAGISHLCRAHCRQQQVLSSTWEHG